MVEVDVPSNITRVGFTLGATKTECYANPKRALLRVSREYDTARKKLRGILRAKVLHSKMTHNDTHKPLSLDHEHNTDHPTQYNSFSDGLFNFIINLIAHSYALQLQKESQIPTQISRPMPIMQKPRRLTSTQ